jgi:beta-glucosidase
MASSGIINGVPVHASRRLLTDLLKGELGFPGFVVSDWSDIDNLCTRDCVAATSKEAIVMAINAGIDMAMVPRSVSFCDELTEAVQEGRVTIERVDDAVRRILRVKARVGLWQTRTTAAADYPDFGCREFTRAAYGAACESVTLLKNIANTLPLAVGTRILVAGPNADSMRTLNGGWSYSWQGDAAPAFAGRHNTILGALRHVNGRENVVYSAGVECAGPGDTNQGIESAVAAAADVAAVVLVVGENSYCEKPGDLDDLAISKNQRRLARALAETGKPLIRVLNEGRPRLVEPLVARVMAVVEIYLPGNFGGDALAAVLFGEVNRSGRLPFNYPRQPHSLINYWHKPAEARRPGSDYNPQWEFGTGLSYTTFSYSELTLSSPVIGPSEKLTVSVKVTNTGGRRGKEAVLLFTSDLCASVTPDGRRLRKFTKIEIGPGEARVVAFEHTAADLSFVNAANKRVTEPGEFAVQVGPLRQIFCFE